MWTMYYVLKKGNSVVELCEIPDVEYYTEVLGYEIVDQYDVYE